VERSSSYTVHAEFEEAPPRVLVAADEVEAARAILEQPIPADIVEESRLGVPEYEIPVCPRCGAADPLLESVDPVNQWTCEACGAEWQDEDGEEGEGQESGG
jgi:tRNA(Ile2) C34 agmatinyltransferase TiaS